MELELLPADWKDYRRFVGLCCVPTLPFNSGKCWTVAGDKAFIGYNHPYRFNHCRNQEFSKLLINRKYLPINWLNDNVRLLNRVMVRPQYRGQGIATQLVRQTLPLVGVTYIECLTFAELIMGVLHRCGFVHRGDSLKKTCGYWLWTNPVPNHLRFLGSVSECHLQLTSYRECRRRSLQENQIDVHEHSLTELSNIFELCAGEFRDSGVVAHLDSALLLDQARWQQSSENSRPAV